MSKKPTRITLKTGDCAIICSANGEHQIIIPNREANEIVSDVELAMIYLAFQLDNIPLLAEQFRDQCSKEEPLQ